MKAYFKAVRAAFATIFHTCKFWPVVFILLNLILATLPVANLMVLNTLITTIAEKNFDLHKVMGLAVGLIVLIGLAVVMRHMIDLLSTTINARTEAYCTEKFMNKIINLPLSFLDTAEGRDIVQAAKSENGGYGALFEIFIDLVASVYGFILAAAILMEFHIGFAIIFIVLTLPGCISSYKETAVFDKFEYNNLAKNRFHTHYRWILTDASTAKDVRMYDLTEPLQEKYFMYHKKYLEERKQLKLSFLKVGTIYKLIQQVGVCFFLVSLVWARIEEQITIGDLMMYSGLALTFMGGIEDIANSFDNTVCFSRWLEYTFNLYDQPCPDEREGSRKLEDFKSLVFDNVYFKYPGSDQYVLKGISFVLNKGERLSIVGINGAGKTTIVKLMLGLYEIESGEILINGYPMQMYDMKEVRKQFSVLFQDFATYPLTVRENIGLSNIEGLKDDKAIIEAMKQSGAYEVYSQDTNDLDTYMSREFDDCGVQLSRGQWQILGLARAYFRDTKYMILDEPSAALDPITEDKIFKQLYQLSKGKSSITISHRLSNTILLDRILVLENGGIIEQGSHKELLLQNGRYAHLFKLQAERYQ